jgi:uncharacterized membrane protein YraQ (UPF0718 family)
MENVINLTPFLTVLGIAVAFIGIVFTTFQAIILGRLKDLKEDNQKTWKELKEDNLKTCKAMEKETENIWKRVNHHKHQVECNSVTCHQVTTGAVIIADQGGS